MLYSSIVYGLLRDDAVCSGLPVEPAPNTPCAAFLMSPKRAERAEKAKREYIFAGLFTGAALGLRFLREFGGS
jgi:hypothetical protein